MENASIAMVLTNAFRPDPRVIKEAKSLSAAGYKLIIVAWDREGNFPRHEEVDGIQIERIFVKSGYGAGNRQVLILPRFWRAALKKLWQLKPDVIHCHDLDTSPVGAWYSSRHGIPWIYDAHECYPEQIGPQVNRFVYYILLGLEKMMTRRANRVITVGEILADRFRSLGGTVTVVGNYQDPKVFRPTGSISRATIGIPQSSLTIAYIGGFTRTRAILPLLEAAHLVDNVTVILGGDGVQRNQIENALPRYPNVHYLGWIDGDQIVEYLDLADVVYYGLDPLDGNSQYSAPNALFNALVLGKPILTTNVGEIAKIVRNNECGVIVEAPEASLIATALTSLADERKRTNLAANAFEAAKRRYNWAEAERQLLSVYRDLSGSGQVSSISG